jgi:hypothetical protein
MEQKKPMNHQGPEVDLVVQGFVGRIVKLTYSDDCGALQPASRLW